MAETFARKGCRGKKKTTMRSIGKTSWPGENNDDDRRTITMQKKPCAGELEKISTGGERRIGGSRVRNPEMSSKKGQTLWSES